MRVTLLVGLVLVGTTLAGCIDGDDVVPPAPVDGATLGPTAVVALIDTGINPYHEDFRDDSLRGHTHPSLYLPGYPEDAVTLALTLDAPTLEEAHEADMDLWESVTPGVLYWFKGTKIVAAIAPESGGLFSTGHGTMVASRAAGNAYSLCPECRIAVVQGFSAASVAWAGAQPWIDVQSNSWSPAVVFQQADAAQSPGLAEAFETAASQQLVFSSAGNGIAGKGGVVGHPSFTRSTSGPPGVIAVGGHDNGEVILWSGSAPHVVADACRNWAALGNTIDAWDPGAGGGTSSASPYAAGAAARILLEARVLLADTAGGTSEGIGARGDPGDIIAGPLADGIFTLDEVKEVLYRTASQRPVYTEHDGDSCRDFPLYNTVPVAWDMIPHDVPSYHLIGWGGINIHSLDAALEVVAGTVPLPERSETAAEHARYQMVRDAYNGLPL